MYYNFLANDIRVWCTIKSSSLVVYVWTCGTNADVVTVGRYKEVVRGRVQPQRRAGARAAARRRRAGPGAGAVGARQLLRARPRAAGT